MSAIAFVERLSARDLLCYVVPELAGMGSSERPQMLLYIDASRAGLLAARVYAWLSGIRLRRLDFDACSLRDNKGRMIWLRIYYEDFAILADAVATDPEFRALASEAGLTARGVAYVTKQYVPGVHVADDAGLWRALYLLNVFQGRALGDNCRPIVFLRRRPWWRALLRYAATLGIEQIIPTTAASGRLSWVRQLLRRDAKRWRSAWRTGNLLPGRWRGRPRSAPGPARLALNCYGQFNLERPELHSDFFLLHASSLPAERVIALFDLPSDPLTPARDRELRERKIDAVALTHDAAPGVGGAVYRPGAGGYRRTVAALSTLLTSGSLNRCSFRAEASAFGSESGFWTELLGDCGAKLYLTWYKYSAEHCAIAEAMQRLGGALACYQRSYEGVATPQTRLCADLYFSFSRESAEVQRAAGSGPAHFIVVGYLGDHRFAWARRKGDELRRSMRESGADRIVALFDEGSYEDPRWGPGHELPRTDYAFLLEQLLADAKLGLVLKPKTPRTLRRRLGPVDELLDAAIRTGRCHLFDAGTNQSSVPPCVAALAADLAVHTSVSNATAGIEAALSGARVVLMDHEGWTKSPLYRLGRDRVVFRDWKTLWDTWTAHGNEANAATGFADWSSILHTLDPFRDGRAAERMGDYLHAVLRGLDEGREVTDSIATASQGFAQRWGVDKVLVVDGR
jgi:hypothetical protein